MLAGMAHRDELTAAQERIVALQRELEDLREGAPELDAPRWRELRDLRARCEELERELEAAQRAADPVRDENAKLTEKVKNLKQVARESKSLRDRNARLTKEIEKLEGALRSMAKPPARYDGKKRLLSEWNRSRRALTGRGRPVGVHCDACAARDEASEMFDLQMGLEGAWFVGCPRCGAIALKLE